MNKMVTSRDELLKYAKEIVVENGIDKLNIRYLAQKSGIATGSVYNYFPSKADLIFSLVEDFWKTIFKPEEFNLHDNTSFVNFIEELYNSFSKHLNKFRDVYTGQLTLMKSSDKYIGKQIEQQYLNLVHGCIRDAIDIDTSIKDNVWTEKFTKDEFSKFVFDNIFFMLINGKTNCEYLKEVINKILY